MKWSLGRRHGDIVVTSTSSPLGNAHEDDNVAVAPTKDHFQSCRDEIVVQATELADRVPCSAAAVDGGVSERSRDCRQLRERTRTLARIRGEPPIAKRCGRASSSPCIGIRLTRHRSSAAFLLGRFDFPGRRLLRAVATLPAALPPLVGVIAFLFLYGESGLVTRIVTAESSECRKHRGGSRESAAIVFVHAYTMYVYVFLFVSAGLERFDATLDERVRTRREYLAETETRYAPASDAGCGRLRSSRLHERARPSLRPTFRWRAAGSLDADTGLEDEWRARSRLRGDDGAGVSAVAGSCSFAG